MRGSRPGRRVRTRCRRAEHPPALRWFKVATLDELKDRLIGVVVTVLAVTFLGIAAEWSGNDVLSFGLALAAIIVAWACSGG